jgi:plasmid maintenance system killer protein
MDRKENNLLKKETIAAIMLLWFFGAGMIAILFFPQFNFNKVNPAHTGATKTTADSNDIFNKNKLDSINASNHKASINRPGANVHDTLTNESQAFVFVNINKKHFLTRFVTFISDEEINKDEQSQGIDKPLIQNVFAVKKVNPVLITKPATENNGNFFIKPLSKQ